MAPAHINTVRIVGHRSRELNRCAFVGHIMSPDVLQDGVASSPCNTTRDSRNFEASHRHVIELPTLSPIPSLVKRIAVVPPETEIHWIPVRSIPTDTHLARASIVQPRWRRIVRVVLRHPIESKTMGGRVSTPYAHGANDFLGSIGTCVSGREIDNDVARGEGAIDGVPLRSVVRIAVDERPPGGRRRSDSGTNICGIHVERGLARGWINGDRHAARHDRRCIAHRQLERSEEHTSELQSLITISYAVFCLK